MIAVAVHDGRHFMRNPMLRASLLVAAMLASAVSTAVLAKDLAFTDLRAKPALTSDDGEKATNISGIACMPASDGARTCLVIDDEGRLAQAASLDAEGISGGGKIRILGKAAPKTIVGSEPQDLNCSRGGDKFRDLDGEAVAYDGRDFYVTGSHGCSRHGNKFRPSSFVLAKIPQDVVAKALNAGDDVVDDPSVQTSFRLSEALLLAPQVKKFFTADLMDANGLNIEGLLVAGGKLYAGLRAPVVAGEAFVVEVPVAPLFDTAMPLTPSEVREHRLALGKGRGIRDLAPMPDGRILVLGGPAQDDDVDFALYVVDPAGDWTARRIGVLDDLPGPVSETKAEAVQVLSLSGSKLEVLVMFDGLKSGGPRRYTVTME
jgi:hypothetical protein